MKWIFRLFTLLYLGALGFYLGASIGWFGHGADALAGDIMRWLGLPWHMFATGHEPWIVQIVELLAPAVNLGVVWIVADLIDSDEE